MGEHWYEQALHWFQSTAFESDRLGQVWSDWLEQHPQLLHLHGHRVYVGDSIKISKEGRKMPGVKRHYQVSENVNKPQWIRGHYFSGLGLLLGPVTAVFACPIIFKLHDGLVERDCSNEGKEPSLVEKMADLCCQYMEPGSYVVLDAYYGCQPMLHRLRQQGLHLISRVRMTTVTQACFCQSPQKCGRGRRRKATPA